MRDEDNKEPFAAHGGLQKPPVPPVPEQSLVLAPPPRALAPREPADASGDMCQSHPFLWGAHMALAHSSPTRGSSGAVVMKGINTGTWKEKKKRKKKSCFVVQKILVSDTACYCQTRLSEIGLPSPDVNELRWWSWLGPVKPQILHSLT